MPACELAGGVDGLPGVGGVTEGCGVVGLVDGACEASFAEEDGVLLDAGACWASVVANDETRRKTAARNNFMAWWQVNTHGTRVAGRTPKRGSELLQGVISRGY